MEPGASTNGKYEVDNWVKVFAIAIIIIPLGMIANLNTQMYEIILDIIKMIIGPLVGAFAGVFLGFRINSKHQEELTIRKNCCY